MHIIQEEIGIPKITPKEVTDNCALFVIEPLPQGYGMTLGNALRRVLLSSIPGAAMTGIKIEGVRHEYSTLEGLKDSILELILNLKEVDFKKHSKEPVFLKLKVDKSGEIKAKDIETTADVEVLNPDYVITTLDRKAKKLEVQIRVEKGVGYLPASKQKSNDPALILVDAVFSPVKKVRFDVTNTRVAQMTNLDKLELEIETNGSLTAKDALTFSSNVLRSYFDFFNTAGVTVEEEFISKAQDIINKQQKEEEKQEKTEYTPIEILNFSPRTLNALINGGIGSIEQLVLCTESRLGNLRGFGKKAMDEVKDGLAKRELKLKEE